MTTTELSAVHPKVSNAFRRINQLIMAFVGIGVVFTAGAFLAMNSLSTAVFTTLLSRAITYVVIGLLLLASHRKMVGGKRRAWIRLRVVSIIAPIAILLSLLSAQGFPVWAMVLQCVVVVIYGFIAVLVNQEHMHAHFPKPAK